jgi:hypothetical protein
VSLHDARRVVKHATPRSWHRRRAGAPRAPQPQHERADRRPADGGQWCGYRSRGLSGNQGQRTSTHGVPAAMAARIVGLRPAPATSRACRECAFGFPFGHSSRSDDAATMAPLPGEYGVRASCRKDLADRLAVGVTVGAKYWSEWQDLNLRPPRPERVLPPEILMISV